MNCQRVEKLLGPGGLEALKGVGAVDCRGYGITLTPWWCIENQLLCAADYPGWPCHDCEQAVGLAIRAQHAVPLPGRISRRKLPAWWGEATPAVRRAYLQE